MVSVSVVMAPNPRTYRLVQDSQAGRETLFETQDRGEMVACIRQHMAHRLINRARHMARAPAGTLRSGYSAGALVLSWLSGFTLGVLALFVMGILLSRLKG